MERTFIAIKPDGVKRELIGEIISRFEKKGYKIVGLKMMHPTLEIAQKHYEEHVGKPFYERLIRYITSGPIVVMVLEGLNVIHGARKLMGATDPNQAEAGSIRSTYAQRMEENVIHGSDSPESAEREINIYFRPEELCNDWKTMMEIVRESVG